MQLNKTLYLLIAGGRDFDDYEYLKQSLNDIVYDNIIIISGAAKGADSLGEKWAAENGHSVLRFNADWDKHGRSAGPIRNAEMVKFIEQQTAKMAVFFWNGKSSGTKHCIECCKKADIEHRIYPY